MNNGTVGSAQIRIDADTASAVKGLQQVGRELDSLVPGGNAVASVFERIQGGALQLVQGLSRNMFKSITQSMNKVVSAGIDTAKTMEMAKVAFDNLLDSGENVDDLLNSIQENAVKTPFDTDALTLSTQKLALITKNGAQAQSTVLALGKALAAAGRGTAEMNRMATNLQQIGQNAKATERDLREFGNAGVDIVGIVAKFSDEFKESGLKVTEARDWLKSISDPYTVISNALIKAGNDVDGFAKIYEDGAMTIGQALENMSDSISVFGYRVLEQSGVMTKFKSVLKEFQESLFLDHTFVANTAQAIEHLIDKVRELDIVRPIIEGIKKVISAFAAGQFDNVIVFFRNLFNAIKQFTGLRVIANIFEVIFDLFSDNHTAEEVARVATQIGNLIRAFLELKMAMSIYNYAYRLTDAIYKIYNGVTILIPKIVSLFTTMTTVRASVLGVIGILGSLIAVIAVLANTSGGSINEIFASIGSGIKSFFDTIGNAIKEMANFGWNLIVGLYNGIVEGFNAVIGKIKEIAQAIVNTFARVFQIHSPSKVMRDYIGHNIMLGIIAGINDMRGEVAAAVEEVQEELVKLQADYVKELNEFGALDLVEQVRVYKEFASLYAKGTRARLEMDDKVHDAETAITKEMISLIEDFNKAFDKAYLSAKNYYDMFEYTQVTLTRTTKSVIEGLRRQNDNMEKYYKNLYQMSQMGFDEDFMSYVYDQGMDAASEVAGLSQATAEQIEEINEMWRTRGKIATDIAVLNTKKLKEETLDELDYLQTGLETKVLDYYDSGTYLMYQFTRGIYDMMPTVEDAMYRVAASASKSTKKAADDALTEIDTTALSDALTQAEDFIPMAEKMNVKLFDTADAFSFIKNLLSGIPWWGWAGAGVAALAGVAKWAGSVKEGVGKLTGTAKTAGNVISGVFKTTTTEVFDFTGNAQKASTTLKSTTKGASAAFENMSKDITGSYTKVTKTTQDSTDKMHKMTYSWSSKTGQQILKPFRTAATRIKGFFGTIQEAIDGVLDLVANTIGKGIDNIFKLISKFAKGILDVINTLASGIMKIVKTLAKGLGEAIQALLKPLSDVKLLLGVAVLGALAVVLIALAKAGQMFAEVEWESLGKMAAVTVALIAVSAVMGALGNIATYILLGAAAVAAAGVAIGVAMAAIGLGFKLLTDCLAEGSQRGKEIDIDGILNIIKAVTVVALGLSASTFVALTAAISGLFHMAVAGELLVIANALAKVSQVASQIQPGEVAKITATIAAMSGIMTLSLGASFFGAISGLFQMAVVGELAVIAESLAKTSAFASAIKVENIAKVGKAIGALAAIDFGSVFGSLFQAISSFNMIGTVMNLEEIVNGISRISQKFEETKDISVETVKNGVTKIKEVMAAIQEMFLGDFITAIFQNWQSSQLEGVAESVERLLGTIQNILKKFKKAEQIAGAENTIKGQVEKIKEVLQVIDSAFDGNFFKAIGQNWQSSNLEGVAESVDRILESVLSIVKRIKRIESSIPDEDDIKMYIGRIKGPIQAIDEAFNGDWAGAQADKSQASSLMDTASALDTTLGTVQSMCNKLSEFMKLGYTTEDVTNKVESIKKIVWKLAEIGFSQGEKELKGVSEKAKAINDFSSSFDTILGVVQSMCNKLKELQDNGYTIDTVKERIGNVEQICWRLAEIQFSQSGDALAEVAKKAESIKSFASSFDTILGTVQSLCKKLKAIYDDGYNVGQTGDDHDINFVMKRIEAIVSAIAEVKIETSNDIGQMAEKAESVKKLAENVDGVITGLTTLITHLKAFNDAWKDTSVEEQVRHINDDILRPLMGDASGGGITIPETLIEQADVDKLGIVKQCVDKISEIAASLKTIEDVSNHIVNAEKIVEFVKNSLAQLPAAIATFTEEFKKQGEDMAQSFIGGWQNKFGDAREVAHQMQGEMWSVLESKMQDEFYQGQAMANKFLEGWIGVVNNSARAAGENMQGKLWDGIEGKMQDEFLQGDALAKQLMAGFASDPESWKGSGGAMVEGVGVGIDNNMWRISRAVGNISQTAITRLKQLLDIHSPSKVMAELGGYVAEGFADGITDQLQEVETAGEALAEAVMDGYNDAIQPLELSAFEARAVADQESYGRGYVSRSTSVVQNNNIYNNMDMSQALGQIAWEVSRS